MSIRPIRKAVFPVAGLGTRLLPATKTMPKEMLTVVDRPLIQYAVDEAREAGIEQMIFVTGRGKASLVDYFDIGFELEATMAEARQEPRPARPRRAPAYGEIVTVRQQRPLGLGHAVWCARHIVGDEPFAVLLPDDLMVGTPGALKQMVDAYADARRQYRLRDRGARRQDRELWHHHARRARRQRRPRCAGWSRSPPRPTRRHGSAWSGATSSSPRSWRSSTRGSAARAARSS